MSFFKDFKDDFSDAVDEMSGDKPQSGKKSSAGSIDDSSIDVDSELSKLDGLLEKVSKKVDGHEEAPAPGAARSEASGMAGNIDTKLPDAASLYGHKPVAGENAALDQSLASAPHIKETTIMDYQAGANGAFDTLNSRQPQAASDENALITAGMTITGDLDSTGSVSVQGTVNGNIRCSGKLTVTGSVNGNSQTSEFVADQARIAGEVVSSGTVKIGVGSVIIGNVSASSAVIAGAVKGDIDVQGPVVVDTSAVVMGNIKSKSVQINNGAIIEGFCSQSYADVDVSAVFGESAQ